MVITPFNTMASPAFLRSTSIVPTPSSQAVAARCPTHLDDIPCETTPSDRVTPRPIHYCAVAAGIPAEEEHGGPCPPRLPSCRRRPQSPRPHYSIIVLPLSCPGTTDTACRAVHGRVGYFHLEICPS